jgi:hypothetical protein
MNIGILEILVPQTRFHVEAHSVTVEVFREYLDRMKSSNLPCVGDDYLQSLVIAFERLFVSIFEAWFNLEEMLPQIENDAHEHFARLRQEQLSVYSPVERKPGQVVRLFPDVEADQKKKEFDRGAEFLRAHLCTFKVLVDQAKDLLVEAHRLLGRLPPREVEMILKKL